MQNRAIRTPLSVSYDSFQEIFRAQPDRLYWFTHCPHLRPIQDLHHHDAVEVGYCSSGAGIFLIDGAVCSFSAPCVTVLYPGQLHKARSLGEQRSQWMFITFREEAVLPPRPAVSSDFPSRLIARTGSLSREPELVRLAKEAAAELEGGRAGSEECARALLAALLIRHRRLMEEQAPSLSSGEPEDQREEARRCLERLRPVMEYLSGAYAQELTVEDLAARFYVNPTTLRKWFRGAVGVSPLHYLHRVRISAACSLLRGTGRSVLDIAMEVGYRSSSSFNRHFLEECGCSPVEYRRRG